MKLKFLFMGFFSLLLLSSLEGVQKKEDRLLESVLTQLKQYRSEIGKQDSKALEKYFTTAHLERFGRDFLKNLAEDKPLTQAESVIVVLDSRLATNGDFFLKWRPKTRTLTKENLPWYIFRKSSSGKWLIHDITSEVEPNQKDK
jgi:hypothetical protein